MSIVSDLFTAATGGSSQFDSQDLYQLDHRKFVVQHCDAKARARRQNLEATKANTGLISGLEKLAGVEGTGVFQEAMDAIVSATHVGGAEWEAIVNGGAEGVLSTIIGASGTAAVTDILNKVSPHGVNTAVTSAQQIYDKIKDRNFDWRDIPQYTSDFKHLFEIGKTVIDPFVKSNAPNTEPVVACSASPYAMDLIQLGVKFKFLFVVEINLNPQYQLMHEVSPAFVVKTTDRPSITYEYEDVNMYNFRTKVLKKSTFAPLTMSFYDDEQNHAVAFYNAITRMMTPIINNATGDFYEETGMDFKGPNAELVGVDSPTQGIPAFSNAASVGPLMDNCTSIIDNIIIHHVYLGGTRVNQYKFIRPRVTTITMDSLDMSSGETTELHMEFAYDGLEVTNNIPLAMKADSDDNIDRKHTNIRYPLGGAGSTADNEQSKSAVQTMATGAMAEWYASGASLVDGMMAGATKMAGDAYNSVSSAAESTWNSITTNVLRMNGDGKLQ